MERRRKGGTVVWERWLLALLSRLFPFSSFFFHPLPLTCQPSLKKTPLPLFQVLSDGGGGGGGGGGGEGTRTRTLPLLLWYYGALADVMWLFFVPSEREGWGSGRRQAEGGRGDGCRRRRRFYLFAKISFRRGIERRRR